MIKVGVVGFGLSATIFHLPFITASSDYELVAISSSQRAKIRDEYPFVECFTCAETLIEQSQAELVIITAPNEVHYPLAKRCLEQGKHVVLEKPMVVNGEEADKLNQLAEEKGLVLSVYHNRRWDGDFLTVKKLIENQQLGQLHYFESHFDRFRPVVRDRWREQPGVGTGMLFDLGSHLIDQVLVLFGLPTSVTGQCLALREGSNTTDYFHVLMHYQGLEVILHASPFCAGPNQRFHLQGSKGAYSKCGLDPQEDQLRQGMMPDAADFGVDTKDNDGTLFRENLSERIVTEKGCYSTYYEQLAKAILHAEPVPVTGGDGKNVIKLLELVERSSNEGKTLPVAHQIK